MSDGRVWTPEEMYEKGELDDCPECGGEVELVIAKNDLPYRQVYDCLGCGNRFPTTSVIHDGEMPGLLIHSSLVMGIIAAVMILEAYSNIVVSVVGFAIGFFLTHFTWWVLGLPTGEIGVGYRGPVWNRREED